MSKPPTVEPHVERPGPAEFRDPLVRREMQKAAVWFGMALAIAAVIVLGQPLLLIVGGAIFAVFLDGGVRLLGRYIPIPRGWRLLLVLLATDWRAQGSSAPWRWRAPARRVRA